MPRLAWLMSVLWFNRAAMEWALPSKHLACLRVHHSWQWSASHWKSLHASQPRLGGWRSTLPFLMGGEDPFKLYHCMVLPSGRWPVPFPRLSLKRWLISICLLTLSSSWEKLCPGGFGPLSLVPRMITCGAYLIQNVVRLSPVSSAGSKQGIQPSSFHITSRGHAHVSVRLNYCCSRPLSVEWFLMKL